MGKCSRGPLVLKLGRQSAESHDCHVMFVGLSKEIGWSMVALGYQCLELAQEHFNC